MEQINGKQKPSSDDYFRVSHAAAVLAAQACTVSAKHIQDGMLRLQFNREVAYYARGIVRDVAEGKKSPERGLKELKDELKAFAIKSAEIGRKSVGIIAGYYQFRGGVGICIATRGTACVPGLMMAAHGINNIVENSVNLARGNSEMQGPVRKFYHSLSKMRGGTESDGDKTYALLDLGSSGWSMLRKELRSGSWKLFRNIPSDSIRAFRQMSTPALFLEVLSDSITAYDLYNLNSNDTDE
jgi:hypothetical protein